MEGVFGGWMGVKLSFGVITPDDGSPKVLVNRSNATSLPGLGTGARVSYEVATGSKSLKATNIVVLVPGAADASGSVLEGRGTVVLWKHENNFGIVTPDDRSAKIYVRSTILPPSEGGYLCEGCVVDFKAVAPPREPNLEATVIRVVGWNAPSDEFIPGVDMGPSDWPDALAALAEPEQWGYKHATTQETFPVLRSYIRYTYRRLTEMPEGVRTSTKDGVRKAFNTGLVTPNQEEIFGVLVKHRPNHPEWRLAGFKKASDREFMHSFAKDLPMLAEYWEDPSVLIYDRRCPLILNIDHIVANLNRLPKEMQDNVKMVPQYLNGAQATMEKRVKRNYKTAIPQYYRDKGGPGEVQLLLPICLTDLTKADLALTVEQTRERDAYLGSTILTLDMAYKNARLLSRPDTEWLQP